VTSSPPPDSKVQRWSKNGLARGQKADFKCLILQQVFDTLPIHMSSQELKSRSCMLGNIKANMLMSSSCKCELLDKFRDGL